MRNGGKIVGGSLSLQDGIFVGPEEGAKVCPTVVGMKPTQLKSEQAEHFLKKELPSRLEKEVFVILGNVDEDIEWFYNQIRDKDKAQLALYNPRRESEVVAHEEALQKFLQRDKGGLVTLGSLFNGMESTRVVFVYENPYASHFRANYLRVSVELILIDRNDRCAEDWNIGTAPKPPAWRSTRGAPSSKPLPSLAETASKSTLEIRKLKEW